MLCYIMMETLGTTSDEREERDEQPTGTQPRAHGRATGAPLLQRAGLQCGRPIGIRAAPRGLHDGDAPVWGAHPGSREDAGVPGGLPRPTRNAGRVILKDGLWVAEGVKDYGGGRVFHVVAIVELHDGKM